MRFRSPIWAGPLRRLLGVVAGSLLVLGPARSALALAQIPTVVTVGGSADVGYSYLVNGQQQLFVGMGYNPIYGQMPYDQRAGRYYRDFKVLCQAGVNTITGWDADKGFQQDSFDELTLDSAAKYSLGVVMPIFLPLDGNYADPQVTSQLLEKATAKVARFRNHPAVRMWGAGNEVLSYLPPAMQPAFLSFYLNLADAIRSLDANHPVIYRDAEDRAVPLLANALVNSGDMRPWLLYGMNVYNQDPGPLLDRWPSYGLNRPLAVSEFGTEATASADRGRGYASMWRSIRGRPGSVLGGAPYVWTTQGPEPTDRIWGLMDANSQPVDTTFDDLQQLWRAEPGANHASCA